jgi:hypothetical protein
MNHRIKDSSMYEVKLQVTRKFSSIEDDVRFSKKTRIFERSPLPEFQKSFLLLGDQLLLLRASFSLIESAFCPHAKNFISHSESSFGKPPADPFGALQLDLRTRDSREIDLFRIASGTARADNASALEERKTWKAGKTAFSRLYQNVTLRQRNVRENYASIHLRRFLCCDYESLSSRNHHRRTRLAFVNLDLADRLDDDRLDEETLSDCEFESKQRDFGRDFPADSLSRGLRSTRLLFLPVQLQKSNNFLKRLHKSRIDGTVMLSSLDIELTSICIMIVQDSARMKGDFN